MEIAAQFSAVALEQEPAPKSFHSPAEPRRRLSINPDAMFPRLLSRNKPERDAAFKSFGMEFSASTGPEDIRLFAVNLDSDAELERVLLVKSVSNLEATVMKRGTDGWWEVGHFSCCSLNGGINDPFLELRQTVSYGVNDIIIHAGGSQGLGVAERRLMVFRLWRGTLYKALDIVESANNLGGSEDIRTSYPDTSLFSEPRVITVHRSKETRGRKGPPVCELYRWDADKFAFLRMPPDREHCGSK